VDGALRRGRGDGCGGGRGGQDEPEQSCACFFVGLHAFDEFFGFGQAGGLRGKVECAEVFFRGECEPAEVWVGVCCAACGGVEPDGDGLAVGECGLRWARRVGGGGVRVGLEGVREGVPEIEQCSAGGVGGGFAFVCGDDGCLDADVAFDEFCEGVFVSVGEVSCSGGGPGAEARVAEGAGDHAVLEAFGEARAELSFWEFFEGGGVCEDERGLVEGAEVVFEDGAIFKREVDAGFAADGGIDHAEEGGGALDELAASLVCGCCEAREVCDGAAAEGDDGVAACEFVGGEGLGEGVPVFDGFAGFASREVDSGGVDARCCEGGLSGSGEFAWCAFVYDEGGCAWLAGLAGEGGEEEVAQASDESGCDGRVVDAAFGVDGEASDVAGVGDGVLERWS